MLQDNHRGFLPQTSFRLSTFFSPSNYSLCKCALFPLAFCFGKFFHDSSR